MAEEEVTPETDEATLGDESPEATEPVRELPEDATLAAIVEPAPSATWTVAEGEWVVVVDAAEYVSVAQAARDAGFTMFVDLCGVDYFRRDPRFEVVLNVVNQSAPMRLRIRVGVDGADPKLPSVTGLYPRRQLLRA